MKQEYVSYIREQLHAVLGIDSPSGCTEQVQEYLCGTLRAMGYEPHRLKKGGVHVTLGGEGAPLTLLSHADTLGAVVQYIKPNGRLAISNMTLNVFNAEAENVRVITRFDGAYEGTLQLCNASVHVNPDPYQARDLNKNMEIVLDYDVKTAEDVKKMGIRPGDAIALEPRLRITETGYVKSRYLDDKASVVALLTLVSLVRAFFAAADARREEKAAIRAENQRLAAEAAAAEAAARDAARQQEAAPVSEPPAPVPDAAAPAPQEPMPEPAEPTAAPETTDVSQV